MSENTKGLAVSCFMAKISLEDFHRVQKSLLKNTGNFDGLLNDFYTLKTSSGKI
jgi:hypothetical protein